MVSGRVCRRVAALVLLVTPALVAVSGQPAAATTGTVYVRGTVTCPSGYPFAGAWVNSSTGGSKFAGWTHRNGTDRRMADISLTLSSVALPTTVSLNVGCGTNSSGGWRYVYNGVGQVRATATGTVFINLGCTTTACGIAPKGQLDSRTDNGFETKYCTRRGAEFWKQMTGSYTPWRTSTGKYGDAGVWDDLAPGTGWAVRAWAEPDSLMIWQGSSDVKDPSGHVGYVARVRNSSSGVEVLIYDRNWNGDGADRNAVWVNVPANGRFIRVPPRFTPHNR
jgi:hypothetical protein